jgi:hypothetical protein
MPVAPPLPFPMEFEAFMSPRRPSAAILKCLHNALQKLEQTNDPSKKSFPELKPILLSRIAELELAKALGAIAAPSDT